MSRGAPDATSARLLRHLSVYTLGQLLRVAGSAISIPVLALLLTPADLGILVTVQLAASVISILSIAAVGTGSLRFLADHRAMGDHGRAARLLSTALIASLAAGVALSLAVLGGLRLLERSGTLVGWAMPLTPALVTVLVQVPRDLAERDLRVRGHVRGWAAFVAMGQVLTTAAAIGMLVAGNHSVIALLWVLAAASAVMGALGLLVMHHDIRAGRWSYAELRNMLRFGVPVVPAALLDWGTQFGDRFVLAALLSLEQVGVYSFGWKIGQVVQQVASASAQAAWDPFVIQMYRREDGGPTIASAATLLSLAGMVVFVAVTAVAHPLLAILGLLDKYAAALPVVLLVGFSYWVSLLQHIVLAPASTHVKTERTLPVWTLAAVTNLVLTFALIPPFGFVGAAWATMIAYLASLALAIRVSRSIWVIPFEWRRLGHMAAAGLLIGTGAARLPLPVHPMLAFFTAPVLALLLFTLLLAVTRFFHASDLALVRGLIRPGAAEAQP